MLEDLRIPKGAPLLVDASRGPAATPERIATIRQLLGAGSTVVVVDALPEDKGWLGDLAGVPVQIGVPPHRIWDGRGFRSGWSPLTAGLSHQDLYWKRFSADPLERAQVHNPDLMIEPLQHFAAQIEGGQELVYPGVLVSHAVGEGTLVLDQRRWWTGRSDLMTLASRNLSSLLLGLNVGIEPTPPPPQLPKGVAYRPINLTPYAPRGLIDEVAQDGIGGWSDQGPRSDMRNFPTGPQLFKGVPFEIGVEPNVCIVLAVRRRPGFDTMPKSVEIAVGHAVEGLYFLHAVAYSGAGAHVAT